MNVQNSIFYKSYEISIEIMLKNSKLKDKLNKRTNRDSDTLMSKIRLLKFLT